MRTDFYFDPICPWCWITSRWLMEVAVERDLEVRWRPFSLYIKNYVLVKPSEVAEQYRPRYFAQHRNLRVVEAVREELGDGPVESLYVEMGSRVHHDREIDFTPAEVLDAVGLDTKYAAAADDDAWDEVILASMKELFEVCGDDIGVPSIVFEGKEGFFGPVISPAPTGEDALALFDAMYAMATSYGFWELKRTRANPPVFAERP